MWEGRAGVLGAELRLPAALRAGAGVRAVESHLHGGPAVAAEPLTRGGVTALSTADGHCFFTFFSQLLPD